jgi:hypothetical protein
MNYADVLTTTICVWCSYLQDKEHASVSTTAKRVERLPPQENFHGYKTELTETRTLGFDYSRNPTYEERLGVESLHFKQDASSLRLPSNNRADLDAIIVVRRQGDAPREERHKVAGKNIMKLERILARTTVSYQNMHVVWT